MHKLFSHSFFFWTNNVKKNTLICNRIFFFPAIDPVCYKMAKENRRKEEPTTNKTDTFSKINSTQNGYGFKLFCYYLYWTFRLFHVHVKGVSLVVYQYYNSKTPKYISHIISVLLEFLIALLSLIIIWCKHLS